MEQKRNVKKMVFVFLLFTMFSCGTTTNRNEQATDNIQSEQLELSELLEQSKNFCEDISETEIQWDEIELIEEEIAFRLEIGEVWKGMYYYFGGRLNSGNFILSKTFQHFFKSDSPIFRFMGDNSIYHRGPIVGLDELRSLEGDRRWLFIIARESNIDDEILTDTISFRGSYSLSRNTREERANHVNFIRYLGIGRFDEQTDSFIVERMYGIDVNGRLTETFNPNITFDVPLEYLEEL